MKQSNARQVKKTYHEEAPVASIRKHDFTPTEKKDILANKVSSEEWDCPKPGSRQNKKMIRENKKRMDKRIRAMMKKQTEMNQTEPLSDSR